MNTAPTKKLLCIAHRGGRQLGTENTLATINKALRLNVDAVEVDVWQVGDELLVTHDRELGRVIVGNKRLQDLDPNEVATLKHVDGSPVVTLAQVIDATVPHARLNIEIKGPGCAKAVADLVQRKMREHQLNPEHIIVSSFDHQQLRWLLDNAPDIKRGVLVYGLPHDGLACCDALKAYSFHPSLDFIDPPLIAAAIQRRLQVWVYTVNRAEDFMDLVNVGVHGVFTDDPIALQAFNNR